MRKMEITKDSKIVFDGQETHMRLIELDRGEDIMDTPPPTYDYLHLDMAHAVLNELDLQYQLTASERIQVGLMLSKWIVDNK